jgi:hypothetical protein
MIKSLSFASLRRNQIAALVWINAALLFSSLSHGQELIPQPVDSPSGIQQATRSGNIQANGLQGPAEQDKTADNMLGNVLALGLFDVHLNALGSLVYNDNIYIQNTHKTSDLIWTLSPDLILGAGDYLQKEENWLTIDYSPSFILFTNHDGNDAIDQDARLNFEWRPASWVFGVKQAYQKLSGAVVEVGNRVSRSIYDTDLYIRYDLSSKTSFELDGDQSINDYDSPLFSYKVWTVAGWMDYWITPKIKLGSGATGGFVDISQNPDQTYEQLLLRAEYDATENLSIHGSVGGELREFQSGRSDRFNGIFSLGSIYNVGENTILSADAYRRTESSLIATDQNYMVTGASVGVSQVIDDKYTLRLTGGFDHSDYYATAPDVNTNDSYDYFFIRTGIDCQFASQFVAGFFYQYQQSESSRINAFSNNLTGITLAYHF